MMDNRRAVVDALAERIAQSDRIKFTEMNEFLHSRGVTFDGDDELTGLNIGQPHIDPGTTLFGPVSAEYVWIVETLFHSWPVTLMLGDPAQFRCGDEPWWVAWTGGQALSHDGVVMMRRPAVNRDVHAVADRAKHAYAKGTQELAAIQYRLGELAGNGRPDPDEAMRMQGQLVRVCEELYGGTVCAVRDETTDDWTWDRADNTYSDGRRIAHQIRVEPEETAWGHEHDQFTLGDGAVADHPRGTITYVTPLHPDDHSSHAPRTGPKGEQSLFERLRKYRE